MTPDVIAAARAIWNTAVVLIPEMKTPPAGGGNFLQGVLDYFRSDKWQDSGKNKNPNADKNGSGKRARVRSVGRLLTLESVNTKRFTLRDVPMDETTTSLIKSLNSILD